MSGSSFDFVFRPPPNLIRWNRAWQLRRRLHLSPSPLVRRQL